MHTFSSGSILAEYLRARAHSIGTAVPPVDSKSLAKTIEDICNVLKNQSELNSNELSLSKEWDKAKIAEGLPSRILKDN